MDSPIKVILIDPMEFFQLNFRTKAVSHCIDDHKPLNDVRLQILVDKIFQIMVFQIF
jgi:hypothetical protein